MLSPLSILLWALFIGATSAGITVAVRALPFIKKWMMERKKPWACDVCMSFWSTGLVAILVAGWQNNHELVLACGPAYPWALWVLCKITAPTGPPPMKLEDSDA